MGGEPGSGEDISRLRVKLGTDYLAGIFRTPDDLASQVAAAVSAQGLTRHMVDRVLGETSVATRQMSAFGEGSDVDRSTIKSMVEEIGSARAVVLHLSEGPGWWSTRLFLLASLLRSLTAVRQIVFSRSRGRFAGMASPAAVIDGLAGEFRELDEFARALREDEPSLDVDREIHRQTEAWNTFLSKRTPPGLNTRPAEEKLKVGMRWPLLERWLGERWVGRCIRLDGNDLNMSQVQQIVDSLLPDVPVERGPKKVGICAAGRRPRRLCARTGARVGALWSTALASAVTWLHVSAGA
jgi:hypothetical protein